MKDISEFRKRRLSGTWPMRLTFARRRREKIESERNDWIRLIIKHKGNVKAVGNEMGSSRNLTRAYIWDLGLWPMLVKIREESK